MEINYSDKLDKLQELRKCEQRVLDSLEKSSVSLVVYENDEVVLVNYKVIRRVLYYIIKYDWKRQCINKSFHFLDNTIK